MATWPWRYCLSVKWICPIAPIRHVRILDERMPAWFDVKELGEDEILEHLDESAEKVANLLSMEPPDIPLGIGGFGMGAAVALYCVLAFANGRFTDAKSNPITLSAVIALIGWVPRSRELSKKQTDSVPLPVFLGHDNMDIVTPLQYHQECVSKLVEFGFNDVKEEIYSDLGHTPCYLDHVKGRLIAWIKKKLKMDKSV